MSEGTIKPMVVLVDDDEDDAIIIKKLLASITDRPFDFTWVSTYAAGKKAIDEKLGHIYLIDYRLGSESGLDLLELYDIKEMPEPFILLTGAGDDTIEQRAMKVGAVDYLVKGSFGKDLLSRVLRYSLQRKRIEAERIDQLIELNHSKDEFIALTSHQLRTPATAVKMYVSMLKQGYAGPLTDDQMNMLEQAYVSNERQLKIVDEILRVAKLDLRQVSIIKQNVPVLHILDDVVSEVTPLTLDRAQKIRYKAPKNNVMISADKAYLTMAICNIVENASKYSLEDTTITVHAQVNSDKNLLAIAVEDEGVGIAEEDIEKLFRKFSRIDNSLSISVGGTGLGLYWSKEVVALHEGDIHVSSKVGKGTVFTIELPLIT